ncbi:MAG TPA: VanZ family protein [Chitinophagales bacterium]|nr:VanZ family protein [Chitinophagales bacterium]HRG84709.1 VanZ family protein [Chitinophagales bacterium]
MNSFRRYAPYLAALWALIILVVSVIPGEDLPSLSIWEPDKVLHAFVYGVLTALIYITRPQNAVFIKKLVFQAILLCILYGFFIELIQLVLPTRKFDILDALANTVGCFIAGALILLISRKRA